MVDIEVSQETTNRLHAILSGLGKADEKVLKPAMQRGLTAGRAAFSKQIKSTYYVSTSVFTKYSHIGYKKVEMRSDGLIGSIEYAGTVIPLIKFNATPQKATYGKSPVKAAVKNGESQVELANAFTAQMPNGHIGIYERKGTWRMDGRLNKKKENTDTKHNEKIKQLYGPSVPRMAENAVVLKTVEDRVNEVINNRMEHEIDRILNGGS